VDVLWTLNIYVIWTLILNSKKTSKKDVAKTFIRAPRWTSFERTTKTLNWRLLDVSLFSGLLYIYIYAFSRCFYPKRLTVHPGYTCFVCVFLGNWTFCAANAMLYHWATGTSALLYLHMFWRAVFWQERVSGARLEHMTISQLWEHAETWKCSHLKEEIPI